MASSDSPNKLLPPGAVVRVFEMPVLGQTDRPTYQSIKKTFKSETASPRDSRFLLSEMVHSHLSVEAEEERRFEERLAKEIQKLQVEIHTTSHKEGFATGQAEGKRLALEAERSRLAALVEGLSSVIGSISEAKLKLAQDYETRLVALAFRIASVVVDHQIKEKPELVANSIRAILEKIGQEEDIRIRLSVEDHNIVGQLEDEFKNISHKGRISLDLDSNIKRGDCIVEASSGEIASFVDEKLASLRLELAKIYPNIDLTEKTGT